MCLVRQQAKSISVIAERVERRDEMRALHEHLDALLDEWLAVEHGNVWKAHHEAERADAASSNGLDARTLGADSMMELAQKILSMDE